MNSGSSERKSSFCQSAMQRAILIQSETKTTQQMLDAHYTSNCKIIQSLSAASTAKWATAQCNLGSNLRRKELGGKKVNTWTEAEMKFHGCNSAETQPLPLLSPGQPT